MNNKLESIDRPRRVGQVWVRRESDEAAIYDPTTGALHRLNPSALAIWELCDGETTIDEMAAAVAELTNLPLDDALNQVAVAIGSLVELGLTRRPTA